MDSESINSKQYKKYDDNLLRSSLKKERDQNQSNVHAETVSGKFSHRSNVQEASEPIQGAFKNLGHVNLAFDGDESKDISSSVDYRSNSRKSYDESKEMSSDCGGFRSNSRKSYDNTEEIIDYGGHRLSVDSSLSIDLSNTFDLIPEETSLSEARNSLLSPEDIGPAIHGMSLGYMEQGKDNASGYDVQSCHSGENWAL